VVGAAARDILLRGVFNLHVGRATADVDLAMAIQDWSRFQAVKTAYIDTGRFRPDPKRLHRILWSPAGGAIQPIDLIPFGGVESEPGRIEWPPDQTFVTNVTGFREAMRTGVRVELTPGLVLPVVSSSLSRKQALALLDDDACLDRLALDLARDWGSSGDGLGEARILLSQFAAGFMGAP